MPTSWPERRPWTRRSVDAVLLGAVGDLLDVEVSPADGAEHTAEVTVRLGVVEPFRQEGNAPIAFLHGFYDGARPTSVTIQGSDEISPGDLLIAHLATAEPSITVPAGWTEVARYRIGDEAYRLYSRVAQAGDESASWTWTSTGGSSPQVTSSVLVAIFSGYSAVHVASIQRGASVTSRSSSVSTTAAASRLVVFGFSSNALMPDHTVPEAVRQTQETQPFASGSGGTLYASFHDAGTVGPDTHTRTLHSAVDSYVLVNAMVAIT